MPHIWFDASLLGLLDTYAPIALFVGIALVISCSLVGISFLLGAKATKDKEKLSSYECGFEPFGDARMKFDIRFYLVAILFIIFDLEIIFLFPWAISFSSIGWFGFGSMLFFLAVLTLGFVYEWKKGALDWE